MAVLSLTGCQSLSSPHSALSGARDKPVSILIFSKTSGYRHKSIESGITALSTLAEERGYTITKSEDPAIFSDESLKDIDVVVLLNATSKIREPGDGGDWLTGAPGEAFQRFVRGGGRVLGIHGASDSHHKWPWYGQLIGGYFASHPRGTPMGTLKVADTTHPSTQSLPLQFEIKDEWYRIRDFNPEVNVVLTLDPASIGEEDDFNPNPVSWSHEFDGGRVFYTVLGHPKAVYTNPLFLNHISGALDWLLLK